VPSVRRAKRVTAAVRAVGLPLPPANIRAVVFPLVRVAYLLEPRPDSNTVLTFSIVDGDGDLQFETNPPWVRVALSPSLTLSLSFSLSLSLSLSLPLSFALSLPLSLSHWTCRVPVLLPVFLPSADIAPLRTQA